MVTPRPADNSKLFTELQQIVDDSEDAPAKGVARQLASEIAQYIMTEFEKEARGRINSQFSLPYFNDYNKGVISGYDSGIALLKKITERIGE